MEDFCLLVVRNDQLKKDLYLICALYSMVQGNKMLLNTSLIGYKMPQKTHESATPK